LLLYRKYPMLSVFSVICFCGANLRLKYLFNNSLKADL
jgi:hypothetical protein